MKAWTNGPWKSNKMSTVTAPNGEIIAQPINAHIAGRGLREDFSTAHLISAAPEMYEALEDLAEWYFMHVGEPAVQANAALAKARGEKS